MSTNTTIFLSQIRVFGINDLSEVWFVDLVGHQTLLVIIVLCNTSGRFIFIIIYVTSMFGESFFCHLIGYNEV